MFNDALQLLVDCFKTAPVTYPHTLDQKTLLTLTRKHRMAATVKQRIFHELPEASQQKITALHHRNFQRTLQHQAVASQLQEACKKSEIPVLFFKGVVAQQWLYHQDDFRPAKDIDILVRPEHIQPIISIIEDLGYLPFSYKSEIPTDAKALQKLGSLDLKHPSTGVIIELHWQLWNKRGEIPTDFDALWQQKTTLAIDHSQLDTLNPHLHLCYLCYHGTGHFWYRLFWLRDIQLALGNPNIDWKDTIHTAQKEGVLPSVLLACYLCQTLFGSDIPPEVSQHFNTRTRALASTIYTILEQNPSEKELVPVNLKQILHRLKWKWQIKSKHRLRTLLKNI